MTINATRAHINRILANLLHNAQRHATRRVRVDVCHGKDRAELAVIGDGVGIAEPCRERIFQRFCRLNTCRGHGNRDPGLGLAVARDIAQAHHGSLHVEDSSAGGARFVLDLPLSPAPDRPSLPQPNGRTHNPFSG